MANINKSFNFRNGVQVDDDNFVVNANGLVGIGTSIPREILDVYGTAKITGLVTTTNLAVSGVSTFYNDVKVGSAITAVASTGIIYANQFVGSAAGLTGIIAIATDGWVVGSGTLSTTAKVGIGTTIPYYSLQVGNDPITGNGFSVDAITGNVNTTGIITGNSFSGFGTNITGINATNISNGTLNNSRLPTSINLVGSISGYSFSGFGTNITGINATNISNGTLNNSRLPTNLNISGIITANSSTITSLTAGIASITHLYVSGVTTSLQGFVGNLVGIASTALGLSGSPDITVGQINSININNTGVITSSNLHIGTGGVNFTALSSGKVGIGTTNPTSKLTVSGDVKVTGIITASSFSGNASSATYATNAGIATYATSAGIATYSSNSGIATYATSSGISTNAQGLTGTPNLNVGIITATSFVGDGSGLTGVGGGIVVKDSGTVVGTAGTIDFGANLSVTFGSGIATITASGGGSSVTISDNSPASPSNGNLWYDSTLGRGFIYYVDQNSSQWVDFSPSGGISIGSSQFVTTSAGIHTLSNVGIGTTNPTSKLTVSGDVKVTGIITASSFSGNASSATYATNAGIATYATSAGIATYSSNSGIATYATSSGISTNAQGLTGTPNLNVGIITATSFVGDGSGLTGVGGGIVVKDSGTVVGTAGTIDFGDNLTVSAISAGIVTITGSASGGSGIGLSISDTPPANTTSYPLWYSSLIGRSFVYYNDGNSSQWVDFSPPSIGILTNATYATSAGISTYATSAGISTYATSAGISTNSQGLIGTPNLNVGIVTSTSFSGSGTNLTGIVTSIVAGSNITVSGSTGQVTISATGGGGSSQWVSTAAGIHTLSNVGIGTTNPTSALTVKGNTSLETLNVSGICTFAGITTVTGSTLFAKQLNVSGISTFKSIAISSTTSILNTDNKLIFGNDLEIFSYSSGGTVGNFINANENPLYIGVKVEEENLNSTIGLVNIYPSNDVYYGNNSYVTLGFGTGTSNNNAKLTTIGAGVTVTGTTFTNNLSVSGIASVGTGITMYGSTGIVSATTFYGSGSGLTNIPAGQLTGTLPAIDGSALTNLPGFSITFTITAPDNSNYEFSGPGIIAGNTLDPVLYLYKGFTYNFVNTTGGSHPFAIRVSNGGSSYTSGVSGSTTGTQTFIVPMNAPSTLYYQCTNHSGMGSTINII